jgi:hypothetical protein
MSTDKNPDDGGADDFYAHNSKQIADLEAVPPKDRTRDQIRELRLLRLNVAAGQAIYRDTATPVSHGEKS